ncbi:DUF262 domain-containing protein [Halorubrum sp. ASP1]|jgi:uncharacterized protein with ParB-like and HNH nuclease domain|uniref:DUF262 domain-containing protein n=2 Tax=Halorubrum TaxID=56688 RepID=A0A238Y6B4_HALEZ|nr:MULTISPECIES: DUF262 domain-containing protein [Halorubrum]TKX60534.1 DUF262 domain-containing protein [Halorubrum sp. ASP1]SNR66755.1 Protein of unknown function [Halorubrum ezzemoulense]
MGYQSRTIKQVLPEINESIFLPAIQREFVWDTEQIVQLFDSVLREYPIGSFIFWNLNGDFANNQIKYYFVRNHIEDSIYPDEFDNVHHRNPKVPEYEQLPDSISLVVDGQQRLSSFYIGLQGTYVEKQKYRQRKNPDSWTRKQLYLNLLSNPGDQTEDHLKLRYDFKFKEPDPTQSSEAYWFRVGDILEVDTLEKAMTRANEIADELESISDAEEHYILKNLTTLYNAVHARDIVNYYEEGNQDNERILDIFVRANEGGTQLSKSEILLSIATSYWASDEGDPIDAKEEINKFVGNLNQTYVDEGYDFGSDFVLKSLLVVTNLSAEYQIRTFTHENLALMKEIWADGGVQDAIESTIELISDFGITGRSLTSRNALIPLVFYFYHNGNPSLTTDSQLGVQVRPRILEWLCSALLNSNFNSRPDQIIEDARDAITEADDSEFPLERIQREIRTRGKAVGFNQEIIEDLFEETDYNSTKIYLLLSVLYYPDPALDDSHEVDHIFPRSLLEKDNLIENYGFDPSKAERYASLRDHVANLQLIEENQSKSDRPFDEWISTRSDHYYDRHHIPTDDRLYELENFPEFIERREAMLRDHIINTFN